MPSDEGLLWVVKELWRGLLVELAVVCEACHQHCSVHRPSAPHLSLVQALTMLDVVPLAYI